MYVRGLAVASAVLERMGMLNAEPQAKLGGCYGKLMVQQLTELKQAKTYGCFWVYIIPYNISLVKCILSLYA